MTANLVIARMAAIAALSFLYGACYGQTSSKTSQTEESSTSTSEWKTLTNEPSRADLFKIIVRTRQKELAKLGPEGRVLPSGPFKIPTDARFDTKLNVKRTNSTFGVDISHYTNRSLDFDKLWGQEIRFVYVKATQGVGYRDSQFEYHWKKLAALPIERRPYRGAYHFLSAASEGTAQAETFLRLVRQSGGFASDDMPPVVDLEWDKATRDGPDRWKSKSPEAIMSTLLAWLKKVQQETGRTPMVYTTIQWWKERMHDEKMFEQLTPYKVWIADYSQSSRGTEVPRVPNQASWHIWQFGESAVMPIGYKGALDINIFKGTDSEFLSTFSLSPR